ncbi:MAG: hypothetical protein AAFY29_02045 [Pseudomonadota bacterium]
MLIRRIVTALREQDWKTATLDFLIVVAGILVGLQIDGIVQDKRDARTGYETLSRIHREMDSQRAKLERVIRNSSFHLKHVDHLATIAADPEIAAADVKFTYEALGYSAYVSDFSVQTAVFDSAVSQGVLDFIENRSVTREIIEHYSSIDRWDRVNVVFARYRDHFDDALAGIGGLAWARVDTEDENALALIPPKEAIAIGRTLQSSPDFQKWLPRAWIYYQSSGELAEERLASVLELQTMIRNELEQGPTEFRIEPSTG